MTFLNSSTMKIFYFLLFMLLTFPRFIHPISPQTKQFKSNEILIQLKPDILFKDFVKFFPTYDELDMEAEIIIKDKNIWLLKFEADDTIVANQLISDLNYHPKIQHIQINHQIQYRSPPNDPLINEQWQYRNQGKSNNLLDADIDAIEAWNITTGGKTLDGQEIVVAVIDNGISLNHSDLEDNIWMNKHEIPDNGIDDDDNGYIDDIYGWNFHKNSPDITHEKENELHGTSVAGIIGARGNNNIGISGINWQIKIMNIVGFSLHNGRFSDVLKAYDYILKMRQRYNESNGTEGAFVVSTNLSWGINFGQTEQAPLWCKMYNELGKVGILNAGATANLNINVDIEGDLPTTCTSNYLISVTNTTSQDVKDKNAAYGAINIDLSAPGTGTFTTTNTYDYFGGTSAATPHVAGAIALLYSVPNQGLIEDIQANPAKTATLMRKFILNGIDPIEDLEGITVTGGRLNLYNSILLLQNHYNEDISVEEKELLKIQSIAPNPATDFVRVQFELTALNSNTPNDPNATVRLFAAFYNSLGQEVKKVSFGGVRTGNYEKIINTGDLQRGIYYMTIRHNNRPIKAIKLMIDNN